MISDDRNAFNGSRKLHEKVRDAFVDNLTTALRVGGVTGNGEIGKISKGELATLSGLSSGTVTSLTSKGDEDVKLETLCKLGYALNLSPAFLLMTVEDWDFLLQAISTLEKLINPTGEVEKQLVNILEESAETVRATDFAKLGRKFIECLRNEDYSSDDRERQMRGVLAMAAIAQAKVRFKGQRQHMNAVGLGALLGDREVN